MSVPEQVLKLLEDSDLSCRECANDLGVSLSYVRALMSKLHANKKVYIAAYRRDEDGGRLYPRAVYALGQGKDVKRPGALSNTEYNRRHRDAKRGAVNSVFALGVPVEERSLGRKSL